MPIDHFHILKDTCNDACHERHACAKGYRQMLASENVSQMMATWRDNWEDVVNSKFGDIIRDKLPEQYPNIKGEMNLAGIYLNECPENALQNVKVLISDTNTEVHVYGRAQAYILAPATVIAHNHAQIYNLRHDADITLLDYSYGDIQAGKVKAQGRSSLNCSCDATIDGSVRCNASGGTVHAISYRSINAYRDTIIYSKTNKNINLSGTSRIEYEQ